MYTDIENFLTGLSESFVSGDVDEALKHVALPLAIYFGSDMVLVQTREELAQLTETYVNGLRQSGLTKQKPVLDDVIIGDDGMITAFTTARLVDDAGGTVALSRAKYFIRQTGEKLAVELVEHSQVAISDDLIHGSLEKLKV